MIKNNEKYAFNTEENAVVKNFEVLKDGKQIAGGFVGISEEELLEVYANDPELAQKDARLPAALAAQEEKADEITDAEFMEMLEGVL